MTSAEPRLLPLVPLLEALDAWRSDASPQRRAALTAALHALAQSLDLDIGRLQASVPALPELDLDLGGAGGRVRSLRLPGERKPVGSVRVGGPQQAAGRLVHAIALVLLATQARARAERSAAQLRAMDQAVRGISGVLDVDRVLQLIADRVRDLAQAQYAAIGIVDADGAIERFITSGITAEERARIGEFPRGRGLLGLIIRENRAYRIRDISTDPRRYGFPPHHPEMHSFLGLPITARGDVVGRLYITNKIGADEFTAEDQELVEMFAYHAGLAIENARLHDQVRRLAVVDERERISRELHDSVIQAIYAQTLALDDVPSLIADDPAEAERRVDEAIDALHAVIRDIRNFIFGLRPVLLETGSLEEGLRHLANELRRSGGVEVAVRSTVPPEKLERLPLEVVAELLAVTREALSNTARHASASRASIELAIAKGIVRLTLADNGRGFDVGRRVDRGHHGLANMRSRVEALGGTFQVRSAPNSGTRIIIGMPHRVSE